MFNNNIYFLKVFLYLGMDSFLPLDVYYETNTVYSVVFIYTCLQSLLKNCF